MSHTQGPFSRLFLSFYYNSLLVLQSPSATQILLAVLVTHTHTHTHIVRTVNITLHYASMVGTVPWVGRESEWSHYTAVTSHSFSLLSNQVSSNNKSNTTTTLLCHPPVVTQCSRFHIKQKPHLPSSQSCCTAVKRLGGVWCSQWGCSWTMKTAGTGQWEVWACCFWEQRSRVWKEVRLSCLKEYGKVTHLKPKLW